MMCKTPFSVLILGASYGLLPALRIARAGHMVTVVCKEEECRRIEERGICVTLPERGGGPVHALASPAHRGWGTHSTIGLLTPREAVPDDVDLVIFAMQEPQFAAPEISDLIGRIARLSKPILSLQNMPPPPFLDRLGLDAASFSSAYSAMEVWQHIDPGTITLASPDAQAVRKDLTRAGDLTVTLATNFKVAPFADPSAQQMLEQLCADVDASRPDGHHLSVRLVASPHLHTPLAKWPMLICGNCRCMRDGNPPVSIADAVHSEPRASREIYDWTAGIVRQVGGGNDVLVPFERYAEVARDLTLPSSLARGLAAGVPAVERIDLLLAAIAKQVGIDPAPLDPITRLIDTQLAAGGEAQNRCAG